MNWVIARLKEPSTYAGLAAFVSGLQFIPHATDIAQLIVPAGTVVAGILAIVMKEKAS